MSAPQPRILETYNSLTDKHLVGYFSNARIRRHLQKSGLISRSGRIIPEKEYRLNAIRRDHQRHVQGCLADAIYHKVLDIEHHHQLGINRRLDCSARKETMESAKIERLMGQVSPMYAPHPPVAPRNHHALCPLVSGERTGRSLRRGPRLRFDYGDGRYYFRAKEPPVSKRQSSELKFRNPMDYMSGASPYRPSKRRRRRAAPVPPPRPHVGDRCIPGIRRGLPVERWFHSTTGFNEQFLINNTNGFPKSPLCSNALVTMIYLGKSKHVSLRDHKDEIKVYQQYCGTENICVYKGDLLEGDTFQFISKRYLGYPFSLTFFLNGLQVDRLSSCCEYRGFQTKRPCRLQRRNTYFRVLHVAGAPPCYRCFLAMGLDKKLYPPKKKLKFYSRAHMCSCSPYCAHSQPCDSNVLPKSIEDSVSLTIASQEDSVDTIDETLDSEQECCEEEEEEEEGEEIEGEIGEVEEEAQTEDRSFVETEGTAQETTTQETTSESEYDEDFEDVEVNEEGQIGDQMNGMSKSSSNDKNRNIDYGKESETSSQKALQASDSEKDKRYSDDRDCEDDLPERRPADSLSSMSTQCSTETDSQAEMKADHGNCKEDCNIKSTSDSAAHAHCGNENGEKKLLRVEENQENSALKQKGIDEADKTKPEDLTAREDTRIFHENIRAMQHQNPEVNGEFKQTGSGESNMNEEEERPPVPWESRVLSKEDGNEEPPWHEEGGVFEDCKPVQEETAKATGNDHPVNSDPEPGDLCANEEEKNAANTEHSASGADGRLLAEGRRSLDVQEAAARAGEATGPGQAPEQDGAAGGDAGSGEAAGKAAGAGDALPQAGTGAALGESAPEEGTVAQERPPGKGTGPAVELGTEGSPGEQQVLAEGMDREVVALGKAAAGTEGSPGEQQVLAEGMDREVALGKAAAGTEGSPGEQQVLAEGMDREVVALGKAVELGTEGSPGEQQVLAEGMDREVVALGKAVELGTEGSAGEQEVLAEGMDREVALGNAVELGTEGSPGEQQVLAEGMDREVALGKAAAGTEGSPGEQQVLAEGMDREVVALGKAAAGTEGPAGALPGGEAHRAVPQGQEGAGGTAEEEAADEGRKGAGGPPAEEEVGEPVSEAGEPLGQGGSAGKDTTVAAVSEGEDAGEDADVAATHGNARAVGPEGEKAVEEDFSEGEEALGKPGALWEAPGDMEAGEAMSGGEGFVKPSQFSQLKVSEEEWMEMGKAVPGAAAALESAQALQRVEDTREESVEADKGPALEVAPGLGALGGARGDPVTEGSSQVEETLAVQEEEGAAEALWSGNPSEGSEAETERAVEGNPEGEAVGGSAGAAGAGSEDEEEATDGAAGSEEPAAGTEGWLRCGQAGGQGRCPGEGAAAGPCGSRAGEPGLVAIAVLGGQAGPAALPGAGGLGTGAVAQAGVTGAAPGAQSGAGAQPVSAAGGEPGGAGEGPAGAPAAAGPEGKREAAAGGEARAAGPAGARRPEPGTEPLGHAGGLGAGALGEQAAAETAPSSPGHGGVAARARGAGGEGLCPGTPPQPAATGTARGRHGRQEPGMERDAGQAGDEQPSAPENTREGEVAAVSASAGPAEQRKDGPVGGSPSVPAAADGGDRSCSSRQDSANPDPLIMSSEEDGEETLL
ncbi:glutamate-rich protein 3 isoform X2 [Zonotrichia leucophrys gambelii]|uniref:glutamate-rich protein 3 isoform X2 n=1 Tax=Zonotrichia leucophrys gambelii TaxID=257770 RepID=UPI003140773F